MHGMCISHQFCRVAWSKWFELLATSFGLPVYRLWIVSLVRVVFKRILRVRIQFEWTTLHLLAGLFALSLQGEWVGPIRVVTLILCIHTVCSSSSVILEVTLAYP